MRREKQVNGAAIRSPGDSRHNFAEVPAMVRPIPPPQSKETRPQLEKAETASGGQTDV